MSLVTRCPQCRTLFRVTPAQLQAREGLVRCGRCTNVFDGFDALALEHPSASNEPPQIARERALAEAAGASAEDRPTDPRSGAEDAERGSSAPSSTSPIRAPERTRRERAWQAGSIALAIVLGLQLAFMYRSELAARYATAKSIFGGLCSISGCDVNLPQRPDLVKIEASDVHMIDSGRPGIVQLTATLRSYAQYDLAYPALDLVLTNANEHALARRIFVADEYLDVTRDPRKGIPPNAEITVALDLDTTDLHASGFRLDLLAAPAP